MVNLYANVDWKEGKFMIFLLKELCHADFTDFWSSGRQLNK